MRKIAVLLAITIACVSASAQNKSASEITASIANTTNGMQALPGFIPMHWDAKKGKISPEITPLTWHTASSRQVHMKRPN
jgi:hypothetical protein